MRIWEIRNYLAKKLNLHYLVGRYKNLNFSDTKPILLTGFETNISNDNNIIFLHIPKTAGSSVNTVFDAVCRNKSKNYKKIPITDYTPPILINNGWSGAYNNVIKNPEDFFSDYYIISGHFPYGIHEHSKKLNFTYFTIIRPPIEREVSSYNYLYQTGEIDKVPFVDFRLSLLDNPQTRMIAGYDYMNGECDEKTYEKAIENLNNYFLVYGPSEKTDEILNALIGINRWPSILYYKSNITKKLAIKNIDKSIKSSLLEKHKYDYLLYRQSVKHFSTWIEKHIQKKRSLNDNDKILVIDRHYKDNKTSRIVNYSEIKK